MIYYCQRQITPDAKKKDEKSERELVRGESEEAENPSEVFIDLLAKYQSDRMDEQRATLDKENRPRKVQRSASSGNKNTP